MEQTAVKQYPELMSGKTILYVHGFGSSAQSGTVKRLRTLLPEAEVVAVDLPLHPGEAMDLLHQVCNEQHPDLIIGTSMGGMYAEMLRGFDRILVNPAFEMGETMHEHNLIGHQTFQSERADGVQEFIVTKALVNEYKQITTQCFACITPEEEQHVYGLFGDEDDVVHTFHLFASHYPHAMHFHGGHRLDDRSLTHSVLPVIRWIDDRQSGRERNVVYIGWSTLADAYGHSKANLNKAFDFLATRYDIYILAPAPTNQPELLGNILQWVAQYLGVAAHDRVVFCNRQSLLYGDYLIDTSPDSSFLGTDISFGSNEFKTWEHVLTYFERIAGIEH